MVKRTTPTSHRRQSSIRATLERYWIFCITSAIALRDVVDPHVSSRLLVYVRSKLKRARTLAELVQPPSPGVAQTCFRIRALTLDVGYIRRGQKFLRNRGSKLRTKVRGTVRRQVRGSKVEPIATESSNPPTSSSQTSCGPHCRFERRSGPTVVSPHQDGVCRRSE